MNDTICAVITGSCSAAAAILRLSGPEAWPAVTELSKRQNFSPSPRQVYYQDIFDGDELLDKALVTFFKAPHSFTGEDVVEISCHGSPYIKGRLLEILADKNIRPAKNGEFSMRAFLNGKMDLAQAQGLCDLIAADNAAAHGAAMNGMEGHLSAKFQLIKDILSELLAQIEVRLDDVDDEMDALDPEYSLETLERSATEIKSLTDTFRTGKLIKEGVKVSIVGAPNAGKSSLLNALLGFNRAIVSEDAGTTRDTIEDAFDYKGRKIILTDTAGIRAHALNAAEREGVERSRAAANAADIIVFTQDISRAADGADAELWAEIKKSGKKIILAENKSDINYSPSGFESAADAVLKISAKTGGGVQELKEEIIRLTNLDAVDARSNIITSAAHYDMLSKASAEIEKAKESVSLDAGLELTAEHIRRALRGLKEIIGEVYADDILEIIFSKFCVGK
ncbi:MAG: tRNA uridine-5-carboxymethylaminomethyl(34) synthesis GTPase MnmE [Elusimicrobium sp.]|jgi:tRNA modification GTPase|nr:tRNA uridine-5-carboxymethylaminomethyl(34) synthesis GTPase MnmE [Elusimicrobium sp.]